MLTNSKVYMQSLDKYDNLLPFGTLTLFWVTWSNTCLLGSSPTGLHPFRLKILWYTRPQWTKSGYEMVVGPESIPHLTSVFSGSLKFENWTMEWHPENQVTYWQTHLHLPFIRNFICPSCTSVTYALFVTQLVTYALLTQKLLVPVLH